MPLSIKSPEADRLARRLTAATGESLTVAVTVAMRERLAREETKQKNTAALLEMLRAISRHCASLPALDPHLKDEIMA